MFNLPVYSYHDNSVFTRRFFPFLSKFFDNFLSFDVTFGSFNITFLFFHYYFCGNIIIMNMPKSVGHLFEQNMAFPIATLPLQ